MIKHYKTLLETWIKKNIMMIMAHQKSKFHLARPPAALPFFPQGGKAQPRNPRGSECKQHRGFSKQKEAIVVSRSTP